MAYKLVSHVIKDKKFFVYKINDFSYRERLFCIFDQEKPFELSIEYKEISKHLLVSPIIGGHGGFQFQEKTDFETTYDFRFETEEECKYNIDEIKNKKKIIDEIQNMMIEQDRKIVQDRKILQKNLKNSIKN